MVCRRARRVTDAQADAAHIAISPLGPVIAAGNAGPSWILRAYAP
jgi:hypothetical protein